MGSVLSSRLASRQQLLLLRLELVLLMRKGLLVLILMRLEWRLRSLPDRRPLWSLWLELLLVAV